MHAAGTRGEKPSAAAAASQRAHLWEPWSETRNSWAMYKAPNTVFRHPDWDLSTVLQLPTLGNKYCIFFQFPSQNLCNTIYMLFSFLSFFFVTIKILSTECCLPAP